MPRADELLKWYCRPPVALPLRYGRRLLTMSPQEIGARVRQRIPAGRPRSSPAWNPPDREALAEWLESRFLFGPDRARRILEVWRARRPEQAAQLVDRARRGLERWEVFGFAVTLDPAAIDWHSGPGAGRYDRRWVWELNRHQFLFTFARAFALTADPAYARRIVALLDDWLRRNPAGRGVNWSSALEVAVRAISWLWTLPLVLRWSGLGAHFLERWLVSLYEHYEYLNGHLSLHTDPTNHLIGEVTALHLLGAALPNLPVAARDDERWVYLLGREIQRQVTPDGVSREQSSGYQRFVLDFYLQVMALARRLGRPLPPVIAQRVGAMLDFVAALAGPEGEMPAIGDSDDARGVPFAELSGENFDDLLASGAALLDRGDWPARAPEVAVWLAGPEALDRAASAERPPPASRAFPKGGYCWWEAEAVDQRLALLFDVGPLGLWPNASHGHADALSIQVKLGGRWLLADPGTGAYSAQPRVRDLLRGTASHNTVTVDGLDQSDPLEVFKWLKPVPSRLLDSFSSVEYDYALARHDGYHRLRHPVTHFRAVLFVRPPAPRPGWIVVDRLEGRGRHRCQLRWHFPPGVELRPSGPQSLLAIEPGAQTGLGILLADPVARQEPFYRVETGLWSRRFGHWEPAPVLVVERQAALPLVWFTFLTPAGSPLVAEEATGDRRQESGDRSQNGCRCVRLSAGVEETVEWIIDGDEHRFTYRRTGLEPGWFER